MYWNGKGELITRTEYMRWKYRNNQVGSLFTFEEVHPNRVHEVEVQEQPVGSVLLDSRTPEQSTLGGSKGGQSTQGRSTGTVG